MPKVSPVNTQECKFCHRIVCVNGDMQAAATHVAQCPKARAYIIATMPPDEAKKMLDGLDSLLESARNQPIKPEPAEGGK